MLRIHNTVSRRKESFTPFEPNRVRMYVCGITVYDYCHLGHARMMIVFDMVARWLRASGYELTYVRNITDIDDKIIRRAVENGETIAALTTRYIAAMHEDLDRLGVLRPDHEPRATQYVGQMLGLISRLQENGLAYRGGDGDVNFAVRKFPGYGRLSGKSLDELRAGERVAVAEGKDDPLDFVLWKAAKPEEPPEVRWPSPFGEGRPGWHIECSAMSTALLGSPIDIHGGGADLQFPHHENEIAQSEGALGEPFVRYWMHNGFVKVDNEKMSKSLGNFFTIREVLARFDPEVVRFFILRSHYRSPLNHSDAQLEESRAALLRLYTALSDRLPESLECDPRSIDWTQADAARFREAMDDDFNTPVALAVLFDLAARLNRAGDAATERLLRSLAGVLGLLGQAPAAVRRSGLRAAVALDDAAIGQAVASRLEAKRAKNFAEADRIRADLAAQGVILEDGPGVTTWRRA